MNRFLTFLLLVSILNVEQIELLFVHESAAIVHECSISRLSKCYARFDNEQVSYNEAKMRCEIYGGKLASIQDQETQDFVKTHFLNIHADCNYRSGGCFTWFDLFTKWRYSKEFFTSDGASNYFNWGSSQPDLINKNGHQSSDLSCGTFQDTTGYWFDNDCLGTNYYLCEYEGPRCNVTDVRIPNAYFDSCLENKTLPMNSVLGIHCHDGYTLRGNETIVCWKNGTWTQFPSCEIVCLPVPLPPHADLFDLFTDYYANGTSAVIMCHPGYVLAADSSRSHAVIKCTEKGLWENIPECVKVNRFQVIRMGINYNAEIAIDCQLHHNDNHSGVGMHPVASEEWLWQKNSLAVNAQDGYTVGTDGTLLITNFQSSHEGVYTCFALSSEMSVGSLSYELRLQSNCTNISDSGVEREILEGNSIILNCPQARIDGPIRSVSWTKNENPLVQSQRVFIVPDGSLVIPKVVFSDNGKYTCKITEKSGLCTSQLTTELIVEASAESSCGNPQKIMSSPWTVSLYVADEKTPFCYGTLIHQKWVLTSAYCMSSFYRKRTFKIYVHFGADLLDAVDLPNNNNESHSKASIRYVESIKIHPQYSPRLFANDVALVKLKKSIKFSESIQPICLTNIDLTANLACVDATVQGMVSGWGNLDMDNAEDVSFHTESMFVVAPELCQGVAVNVKYTGAMFCASHNKSQEPTYAANVGSPFVVENENRVYLLGMFILGERYSQLGDNDYFTKIPKYVPWIRSITI